MEFYFHFNLTMGRSPGFGPIICNLTPVSYTHLDVYKRQDFPNRKQIVHEILHPEDRPAPQSSYSHYSGINYSALEVAVRRIQQDFDFLMRRCV